MLTAALDATRLGARAPLSVGFLRAAAVDYCTSQHQAEAPDNWFEQALAYATAKLHGAAAALSPAGTGIMGQVAGYTAADYLIQHASRKRRYERVPADAWDAILSYIRDPADTVRLADSAERRLLYRYAIPLHRHAADLGDGPAAGRLADLLAERGDLDELRARADAGDRPAEVRLARLLAKRGDLEEAVQILRARADAGDMYAAIRLAELLSQRGDLDELRARADAGDGAAARKLADLLARRGDLDELRARADAGDRAAAGRLAALLEQRGDLDELRARTDAGDRPAAVLLAQLLIKRGDLKESVQILDALSNADNMPVGAQLAQLLRQGDLEEAVQILRARADAGQRNTAKRIWTRNKRPSQT